MAFNMTTFLTYARRAPFGGRLTQQQVEGIHAIFRAWEGREPSAGAAESDMRCLAYILATAYHETGGKMAAVREGFASSDAKARKIVASRAYGKPSKKTGHVYYGRGFVQLTWEENYAKFEDRLGIPLVVNPDLALEPVWAADILVEGMLKGMFTGRRLADYFTGGSDPLNARRVVNGIDKRELIATYFHAFYAALKQSAEAVTQPADVSVKEATPDGPSLVTDKTTLSGLFGVLSAGAGGFLTGINNPWAFLAVGIVALVVVLFLTGRLEIKRKAGA